MLYHTRKLLKIIIYIIIFFLPMQLSATQGEPLAFSKDNDIDLILITNYRIPQDVVAGFTLPVPAVVKFTVRSRLNIPDILYRFAGNASISASYCGYSERYSNTIIGNLTWDGQQFWSARSDEDSRKMAIKATDTLRKGGTLIYTGYFAIQDEVISSKKIHIPHDICITIYASSLSGSEEKKQIAQIDKSRIENLFK